MAVLTPNDNSALSKFQYVQQLMSYNNPDSTAKARAYAQSPLISFITLKYSQASLTDQQTYASQYQEVIAEINCFVGVYTIPTDNKAVAIALSDGQGGVYFPPGFCPAGTCAGVNVTLDEQVPCTSPGVPANCVPPLGTLLDKYGIYLKVTLSGDTTNIDHTIAATVGLCSPDLSTDIINSLLVGHQISGNGAGTFELLNFAPIPGALADLLTCTPLQTAQESGPMGVLANLAGQVAQWLLPEQLHAMFFATSGIGGTTKTFSPFTLTSSTLTATGGLGGSTTSFSPVKPGASAPANSAKPAPANSAKPSAARPSLTAVPPGTITDTVGAFWKSGLPSVTVKTPLGTPIPGVTLTFTVNDPANFSPPSGAAVCDSTSGSIPPATLASVVAVTNTNGVAQLNCLSFGNTVGFKNLHVVIDPSTAYSVLAGGGTSNIVITACDASNSCQTSSTTQLNWLVQTVAGKTAQIKVVSMPGTTQAGYAFASQPKLVMLDRLGDTVYSDNSTVVTASSPTGPFTGAVGGLATITSLNTTLCSVTACTATASGGFVNFSNLGIAGSAGLWTIKFASGTECTTPGTPSGSICSTSGQVTITPGDPVTLVAVTAAGTSTSPGQTANAFTAITETVRVRDKWGNAVAGASVQWSPGNGTASPATSSTAASGTDTTASTSWTLDIGLNSMLASLPSWPSVPAVQFWAQGNYTLTLINGCATGGGKDNVDAYTFFVPQNSKSQIFAIGLNLSSNGAPGSTQNFVVNMVANVGGTLNTSTGQLTGGTNYLAKAGLQSGPNSSKGTESLVLFDFKANPIPVGSGNVYVRMVSTDNLGNPLAGTNNVVNMNVGTCSAGSKTCKGTTVQSGVPCSVTENQTSPWVYNYRNGLAARVYKAN